ncbi:MAG: NAD(P)H-binding protein [Myxococcales bacterium]|nr:NAD(P)H-binding protein [Myxococcales bacterium]
MRVIIFGATGKTGRHVWRRGTEEGHDVTVFGRSVATLDGGGSTLRRVQGDVLDAEVVRAAVADHDAVIVCLGSTGLRDRSTLQLGTRNIVDAMEHHDIERLVVLSAAGVRRSWAQIPWSSRLLFMTLLRNIFADHEAQESIVEASPLDWIIVRSAVLTDKPASGSYTASNTETTGRISREDVADFLVEQITDSTHVRSAISITS